MSENRKNAIVSVDHIESMVYIIRGQQVMLDQDLAVLYGYEVKRLNEQVKRNIERFPDDFMFQLSKEEAEMVKSQFATSPKSDFFSGQEGGRRKLPFVFTEQGVNMLSAVLKSGIAIEQSIAIMRAFREMRHYIRQNQQFVSREELQILTDTVETKTKAIVFRQNETDIKLSEIQESINKINENFISDTELKNFVIFKGQKLEADIAYIEIYKKAKHSIYVIDNYVNIKTLHLLSHKCSGVEVTLFTENKRGRNGILTASEIEDFNKEYPTIQIKPNRDCHDRFIVLDYKTDMEKVYHCGASSKDAGDKVCAINEISIPKLIHPVIDTLLKINS